jgi:hypothetical protein
MGSRINDGGDRHHFKFSQRDFVVVAGALGAANDVF